MKIEGIAAARREIRERAANYAGESCEAADAWRALADATPRSTPPAWAFADAAEDARCSEDPDLIEAIHKVAAFSIDRLQTIDTPHCHRKVDDILEALS